MEGQLKDVNLEDELTNYYVSIQAERTVGSNTSYALYDLKTNICVVPVHKGVLFNSIGVVKNNLMTLLPEEALFMLERGTLVIKMGDIEKSYNENDDLKDLIVNSKEFIPISLQYAYEVFLDVRKFPWMTIEKYQVIYDSSVNLIKMDRSTLT